MKIFTRMDLIIIILTIVGGTCTLGAGVFKIINDRRVAAAKAIAEAASKAAEAERREEEARRVKAEAKKADAYQLGMVQLLAARAKVDTIADEVTQIVENMRQEAAAQGTVPVGSASLERLSQAKLDMKAVDDAFDEILKGVAPAVAEAIVEREKQRKSEAENRINQQRKGQEAARIKALILADINTNGKAMIARARDVIAETVTHTQSQRLGRKVSVNIEPLPDDLLYRWYWEQPVPNNTPETAQKPNSEVGSIVFDDGTRWNILLAKAQYWKTSFTSFSGLILAEGAANSSHGSMITIGYNPLATQEPALHPQKHRSLQIVVPDGAEHPALKTIIDDYMSEKGSDEDLVARVTVHFLGLKELRDSLKKAGVGP